MYLLGIIKPDSIAFILRLFCNATLLIFCRACAASTHVHLLMVCVSGVYAVLELLLMSNCYKILLTIVLQNRTDNGASIQCFVHLYKVCHMMWPCVHVYSSVHSTLQGEVLNKEVS